MLFPRQALQQKRQPTSLRASRYSRARSPDTLWYNAFRVFEHAHHRDASSVSIFYFRETPYLGNDLPRHDDDLEPLGSSRALETRPDRPACGPFDRRTQIPHAQRRNHHSDGSQNQRNPNRPVSATCVALGAGVPHPPRVALGTHRADCEWGTETGERRRTDHGTSSR